MPNHINEVRRTAVIVSGYFNPMHIGHLQLLQAASEAGDRVIVIVNNDVQQRLKKGRIIMSEDDRRAIVAALKMVDEAIIAVDQDRTVCATIEAIAKRNDGKERLIFGNGGDRNTGVVVPETAVCEAHGIEMVFDMGGTTKVDSSSRINAERGA